MVFSQGKFPHPPPRAPPPCPATPSMSNFSSQSLFSTCIFGIHKHRTGTIGFFVLDIFLEKKSTLHFLTTAMTWDEHTVNHVGES